MDMRPLWVALAAVAIAAGGIFVAGRTLSRPAYGDVLGVRARVENVTSPFGPTLDHDVEQRVTGYDVTYVVDGQQRSVLLDRDPGKHVRLAEVDAIEVRARRARDLSAL